MKLFGEYRDETIRAIAETPARGGPRGLMAGGGSSSARMPAFTTARGAALSGSDLDDQFILFQFNPVPDGITILGASEVEPSKAGSDGKPDSLASVQLTSFHIGTNEKIESSTRATLRVDMGKDASSSSPLDTVFWSIAAGLNLYNEAKKKPSDAKDLKTDFNAAFSRRPVEIPGGLGRLSFEVVKHKEPKWWQKVFRFLQSGTGQALTTAIGFPAISTQAVGFLDELLNRLDRSDPEVLFKSRPMTLATTKRARDEFTGGAASISVGVLNPGFCLLARGRDYGTIVSGQAQYMGEHGLLKPKDMPLDQFLREPGQNPFNALTYAVLRVGIGETRLSPQLDFR